jgi:ATP-dependent helicase HrpA
VKDGVALLQELGALDGTVSPSSGTRLTPVGRTMARIPVDPRLARMLVAADASGVLDDTLVVVAALSIQDPRETPGERGSAENQKARTLHARFDDERSDFLALLNLWEYLHQAQKRLSSSAFRRLCRDENLHYLRIREWQDLVGQLRGIGRDLGLRTGHTAPPADRRYELLHRALLTGLLAHVGLRTQDRKDHLGARGSRFAVSPGSGLFAKPPTWVMAGELVETTRLWGRYCARIEPEWIEPAADHLVVRTLSEPRWSRSRGSAVATERVTLYGIPIVTGRTVALGRRDPVTSRELLLRHGLVLGEWRVPGRSPLYAFQRTNRRRLEELSTLEDRVRRRGIVIDEDALLDLYDQRVPAEVVSQRHFENWWRTARRATPDLLTFADEELLRDPDAAGDDAPPLVWTSGGFEGEVTYRFDPTADDDGATVVVPLDALHAVDPAELVSMTNRTREELTAALIRSLPKPLRRHFVPAPDVARELLPTLPEGEPLETALARALARRSGLRIQADDFDRSRVPAHLLPTISVVGDDGQELARSKDVDELRSRLAASSRRRLTEAAGGLARTGLTGWPDPDVIPRTVTSGDPSSPLTGYPCLVDAGEVVDLRVVESAAAQERLHHDGVLRLLLLATGRPHRGIVAGLDARTKLLLASARYPDMPNLFDEAIEVAVRHLLSERSLPWDRASFDRLVDEVRPLVVPTAQDIVRSAAAALDAAQEVRRMLDATAPASAFQDAWTDLDQQWHRFMPERIIAAIGWPMLADLPRYLMAMQERWERITARRDRDLADLLMVQDLQERWCRATGAEVFGAAAAPRATAVRWRIEELRVSVFAATRKARGPVSEKRILTDLAALDDGQA